MKSNTEDPRSKFEQGDGLTNSEKWHVQAFVTSVVQSCLHEGSRERFKMFVISRVQFVGDQTQKT